MTEKQPVHGLLYVGGAIVRIEDIIGVVPHGRWRDGGWERGANILMASGQEVFVLLSVKEVWERLHIAVNEDREVLGDD